MNDIELVKENERLRNLLAEKYPANRLLTWSSAGIVAFSFMIITWFYGIYIIHPIYITISRKR